MRGYFHHLPGRGHPSTSGCSRLPGDPGLSELDDVRDETHQRMMNRHGQLSLESKPLEDVAAVLMTRLKLQSTPGASLRVPPIILQVVQPTEPGKRAGI